VGLIVDGQWVDEWYDTGKSDGRFERQNSAFRHWIGSDDSRFTAESGRYHLYVSLACPWAHRTLIFRSIKQLEAHISVSVVDPLMLSEGWIFSEPEPLMGCTRMYEVYLAADASYEGRVTVPVLWDKKLGTIVNNESADVIRILNSQFNDLTGDTQDFYPERHRSEIDAINDRIYHDINNGVYKTGFATTQAVYEEEYSRVFAALDWLEERLTQRTFLVGDSVTEADWRLFTTLVRFDSVYHGHFKLNRQKLSEFPRLSDYIERLKAVPGISETINQDHIKAHYYGSHASINPTGIVPLGPA
jgi:putative glutathione S-transferase